MRPGGRGGVMTERRGGPVGSGLGRPEGRRGAGSRRAGPRSQGRSPPAAPQRSRGRLQIKTSPCLSPSCGRRPSPVSWVGQLPGAKCEALPQASLIPGDHGLSPQVPRRVMLGCSQGPHAPGLTVSI